MKQQSTTKVLLLAGIPASGKSSYGKWLEEEKGYLFLDLEHGALERVGVKAAWDGMFQGTGTAKQFVHALTKVGSLVVLDWGFPVHFLPIVEALKEAGVEIWWLDGDRDAARQSFVARGTVAVESLDVQMAGIQREWLAIKRVFGAHVLYTVQAGPAHLKPETVFQALTRPGAAPGAGL